MGCWHSSTERDRGGRQRQRGTDLAHLAVPSLSSCCVSVRTGLQQQSSSKHKVKFSNMQHTERVGAWAFVWVWKTGCGCRGYPVPSVHHVNPHLKPPIKMSHSCLFTACWFVSWDGKQSKYSACVIHFWPCWLAADSQCKHCYIGQLWLSLQAHSLFLSYQSLWISVNYFSSWNILNICTSQVFCIHPCLSTDYACCMLLHHL